MRFPTIVAVAVLFVTSACGVLRDSTVATVNGTRIDDAAVLSLARSTIITQNAQATSSGVVARLPGSVGGSSARLAAFVMVQKVVLEQILRSEGSSVTAADRSQAEEDASTLSDRKQFADARAKGAFVDVRAAQIAVQRVMARRYPAPANATSDAAVAAYFAAHRDEFPDQRCLDGVAVPVAQQGTALASLEGGATVKDVVANTALGAQPLSQDGGEVCVSESQMSNTSLRNAVLAAVPGRWAVVDVRDEQGNQVADQNGTAMVAILRVNRVEEQTAQTPAVVTTIRQKLQSQAQQGVDAKVNAQLKKAFEEADVDLNPRYGIWDPTSPDLVTPPVGPVAAATDRPATSIPATLGG
ncbi:MAG: hypothetical protein R2698_07425 [Microthrixaceae bacterium]